METITHNTKLLEGSNEENDTIINKAFNVQNQNPEGPKLSKFLNFWEQFNLENGFKFLGQSIGAYPLAFLIASLILSSLSVGIYWLDIKDRVRDGYTPTTSMSRYETDVLKEFLGSTGDPLLTTVLLRARDGGSMHRLRCLNATVQLHSLLRLNISAALDGESIYYSEICGPFCDANLAINYFYDSLNSQLERLHAGKRPSTSLNLTYPISRANGFDLHLERNFYGARLRNNSKINNESIAWINNTKTIINEDPEIAQLIPFTDIEHIEAIMMTFRADISHPKDEEKMASWEMRVYDFSQNQFNNSLIEMLVLGSEVVDYEMAKEAEKTVPFFVMGLLFMFTFVIYTLIIGAFFYGVMDKAKPLLALGVSLCPVLAITSTFGACTIGGYRTNSVMLIMPFLICGIGVNDAFLMAHSWNRTARKHLPINERLGIIFEEVGPSITITTLTNVVTFLIGALTPTPEISLFCLATAIALGFAYIYTLMLFAPLIYFASIFEDKVGNPSGNTFGFLDKIRQKFDLLFNWILQIYCKIITNRIFGWLLFFGVLIYWYFAFAGTLNIQAKLDTEKILPRSSPILEPHKLISHMVWTEYYPLTILVNNPMDIRSKAQMNRFNKMLDEFEGLKFCKGKQFTILWLRDYIEYCQMAALYDFDFFDSSNSSSEMHIDSVPISETGFDYIRLEQFLSSPFYKHFVPFLRFSPNIKRPINGYELQVPISKFWFSVTYHNTVSWEERINLMQEWRAVAENYADLNVTVWEVNSMFVDQMLSLKSLTLQTTFLTLCCMALVCLIFIQNPLSVATASFAIGSISIGVIGYLSWWHLNLDPVTLCAVLMSIGMSVDFTAHVSYHFQLSHKREIQDGQIVEKRLGKSIDKLQNTIRSIAWPMSQAGLSTVICVFPLIFLQNYIPLVFVKTISLVVIWGLFHGLVLLPAFLTSLPPHWLELNCYRMVIQRLQQMGNDNNQTNIESGDGSHPLVDRLSYKETKKKVEDE